MLWHWLNTWGTDHVDQVVVLQGEAVCMANTRSKGQELGTQFPQCSIAHTEEALKILSFLCSAWIPTGGICGSLFVYRTPSTREPCNYWPCNYTVRQVPHVDRVNKTSGYFFLSARERVIMRSYSCKLRSNYGFNNQATSKIITKWLPGRLSRSGMHESWVLENAWPGSSKHNPTNSFSTLVQCVFKHLKGGFHNQPWEMLPPIRRRNAGLQPFSWLFMPHTPCC